MSKKVEVIKKVHRKTSCFCKGKKPCNICGDTGIYEQSSYIMVVGKYAYNMDTIK